MTFEFWDTLNIYNRTDYGLLDWLSDIGGLYHILTRICFVFLGYYVRKGTSLFVATELISRLLKGQKQHQQETGETNED